MSQARLKPDTPRPAATRAKPLSYRALFDAPPMDLIHLVKRGVSAAHAKDLLGDFALARGATLKALDLPAATFNKKVKTNASLSPAEGERVIGFARLVGQVEAMVEQSGDPTGFDAKAWLARWLIDPLPALGGARPLDLMDTMEGQNLVAATLARVQSGAYA